MAKFGFKVGLVFAMVVLMGVTVEGVQVSVGNFLSPPISTVTVHCVQDHQDMGTRAINPWKELHFSIPTHFFGNYICDFSAPGKRTTSFDVLNSRCNCDSYWGCAWVVRSDGFYCNHDFFYRWAH